MNALSIVCIALGIFVISVRGPLMLFPEKVMGMFGKVLESTARIRVFGVLMALIGVAIVASAWGVDGGTATAVFVMGWFVVIVAGGLLIAFPAVYKRIADMIIDLNPIIFRAIGALGVAVGVLFIYLGLAVFSG